MKYLIQIREKILVNGSEEVLETVGGASGETEEDVITRLNLNPKESVIFLACYL